MANSPYVRSALAMAALELTPPMVRDSLLSDPGFSGEYHIVSHAVLSFGDTGLLVQRSALFDAVRKVLSGKPTAQVATEDGKRWKLTNDRADTDELPRLVLHRGKQRLVLPDFCVLSPDRGVRLSSLDESGANVCLPREVRDSWRRVLEERSLTDSEVDGYHSEFRDTPVHQERSLRGEILAGESSLSSLVPRSRRYYERLVGAYGGCTSVQEFAAGPAKRLFDELSAWNPYEGFLLSLLLSSHSALTAQIDLDRLDSKDLSKAFSFLQNQGDRMSQMGAIEVGLRGLGSRPEIEPFVLALVKGLRDDDARGARSGFALLSALFVLVDGELSRLRLLAEAPPFYRRLASLAQASLIQRQMTQLPVDSAPIMQWAFQKSGQRFYVQSLVDLRLEPRWQPDFIEASFIREDYFGRVMVAANNYKQYLPAGDLYDLTLGSGSESLKALCEWPRPYFPGPLEGRENSHAPLPPDISEAIKEQLAAEEVGPKSFVALVNSAQIFRLGTDEAALAAKALKVGSYRLANIEDREQLLAILSGLGTVGAVVRNPELADELRILLRRYRRDPHYALSIQECARICLVAAASREDVNAWREFVGDWITELAFGDLKESEGVVLHMFVQYLCHAVPELWVSCGRAEAALRAYNCS